MLLNILEIVFTVIVSLIFHFMFGDMAAHYLIGDKGYCYPVYMFGPFNFLNGRDPFKPYDDEYNECVRLNTKWTIIIVSLGLISGLFALGHFIYAAIVNLLDKIKYAFKL